MEKKSIKRTLTRVSAGQGKHKVNINAIMCGDEIVAILSGGEKPHVGAVAVALPSPSPKNSGKITSTSSVFTLIGHKDDEIARPFSRRVAKDLNRVCVGVVGVHVNNASNQDIELLLTNSAKCVEKLIHQLRKSLALECL